MRVIQHVVSFVFANITEKEVKALKAQTEKMATVIPGIISASFNENRVDYYKGYADIRNGNNFTLFVIFEDAKALKVYTDHEQHTVVNLSVYNANLRDNMNNEFI
eukprot:252411_1